MKQLETFSLPKNDLKKRTLNQLVFQAWRAIYGSSWWLAGLLLLVTGYLLLWQRGLYTDDWVNGIELNQVLRGNLNISVVTLERGWIPIRAFHMANLGLAVMLTNYELVVRLLSVLGIGSNSFLLGWLLYRITGSRLLAIISGWLFLMPWIAFEAVLWPGASTYITVLTFTGFYLHIIWSSFSSSKTWQWIILSCLCFIAMLLSLEPSAAVCGLVLVFGPPLAAWRFNQPYLIMLKRVAFVLSWSFIILALFYFLIYRNAPILDMRGGFDTSPGTVVSNTQTYLGRFNWMTSGKEFGQPLFFDSVQLGLSALFHSWKGFVLVGLTLVTLLFAVVSWQPGREEYKMPYWIGWLLAGGGLVWFFTTMLIPGVFVKGQILEYRMLYFPFAGLVVTVASLFWLVNRWLKRLFWARLSLASTATITVLFMFSIIGFEQGLAARYQHDVAITNSIINSVPPSLLPSNPYFVSFEMDQRLFNSTTTSLDSSPVSRLLFSIYEWPGTNVLLNEKMQRSDTHFLYTTRWSGLSFKYSGGSSIKVANTEIPLDQLLLFTYQSGQVKVITSLVLKNSDGSVQKIELPLSNKYKSLGSPVLEDVLVPNNGEPVYVLTTSTTSCINIELVL